MITGMLHNEGWRVNHKRVERIWRQQGLKVPKIQPKKSRRGLMMALVADSVQHIRVMYGAMILYLTVYVMIDLSRSAVP